VRTLRGQREDKFDERCAILCTARASTVAPEGKTAGMMLANPRARHPSQSALKERSPMANQNGTTTDGRDIAAMVDEARTRVEDIRGRAMNTIDTVDRRLSTAMRENPMLVLGAAVGVGYVIGRIFSKLR
jgi:hypothetical protein